MIIVRVAQRRKEMVFIIGNKNGPLAQKKMKRKERNFFEIETTEKKKSHEDTRTLDMHRAECWERYIDEYIGIPFKTD